MNYRTFLIGSLALISAASCDDSRSRTLKGSTTTESAPAPVANRQANPPAPEGVAADNTKVNERDRGNTVTPIDQGNGEEDIQITATIRREMMGDERLSFAAKNVKVITFERKVTLRGPVSSADEKTSVEAIAKKTNGVSVVDNQLEVKP